MTAVEGEVFYLHNDVQLPTSQQSLSVPNSVAGPRSGAAQTCFDIVDTRDVLFHPQGKKKGGGCKNDFAFHGPFLWKERNGPEL